MVKVLWFSCNCLIFFFSSRRRHTRFDCDWSSDVCSSDLNWCQVPQSALFVLVGIGTESRIVSSRAGESLDIVAAIATLVFEWYIARVALDTTGSTAAFVVIVDLVLGAAISRVAGGLY